MKEIKIKNKIISNTSNVFFIAEIGINHNGSLENALKLIDLACLCGADAVKFQKRTPEICVPEHKKSLPYDTPWGEITYLEYRKKIEFNYKQYKIIDNYCREKDIIWFASPWDLPSVDFLEQFDIPCYKIASAKLTDKELIEKIKSLGKPVFLSTGMSTETQIEKAINLLKNLPLVIMHCNSSYPAPDDQLNLNYIPILKKKYPDYIIGYSGHENGISASIVAATLGARVIERHITLDRAMWGSDQAASLGFSGLRRLIRDLKKIDIWRGDGTKRISREEQRLSEKLRNKNTL
ncbi:MAG: N-acetylneuraminate synthase family protein [Promethearchaeota archaeon]